MKHHRRKSRRFRKSRKNRTRRHYPSYKRSFSAVKARGLTPVSPNVPVSCCVCEGTFPRDDTLVPARCLKENRERAHRICQDCWWDPETGFARENAPHGCPGCIKNFPLTAPLKRVIPKIEDIIVISD